jgi:Xaa-Pro aminopeptidase
MQADFFHHNRERFMRQLAGGVAVITGYTQMQRKNDAAFKFEQEANFWWLTGIEAPDWGVVIDGKRAQAWLVAPTVSQSHEVFDGSLSPAAATRRSGIEKVIDQAEAEELLRQLAKTHSVVSTLGDMPHAEYFDFIQNPTSKKMHDTLGRLFNSVDDCRSTLARLRAIKQPEEIAAMKRAISLTIGGFQDVRSKLANYKYEYQVEADFSHYFRSRGAVGHAYDPIVAAGKNACTLHYVENSAKLTKTELLLLDIGAQVDGYAADITRTYALGRPTKRQVEVHSAVQVAQRQIIQLLSPGISVREYHEKSEEIMKTALLQLGLMKNSDDDKNFHTYFPHAMSHGLGVDVHDSLGAPDAFAPGMVLTVEPGIYIPEEGIGVRIEDDILITATGHTNLSAKLSTDL